MLELLNEVQRQLSCTSFESFNWFGHRKTIPFQFSTLLEPQDLEKCHSTTYKNRLLPKFKTCWKRLKIKRCKTINKNCLVLPDLWLWWLFCICQLWVWRVLVDKIAQLCVGGWHHIGLWIMLTSLRSKVPIPREQHQQLWHYAKCL